MENERDNNDGERLPPNEDMGTKNHDCLVPAIHSNNVQTMSMEIGKVGISDNGLKDITIGDACEIRTHQWFSEKEMRRDLKLGLMVKQS